jgi:hypothetical protein
MECVIAATAHPEPRRGLCTAENSAPFLLHPGAVLFAFEAQQSLDLRRLCGREQ